MSEPTDKQRAEAAEQASKLYYDDNAGRSRLHDEFLILIAERDKLRELLRHAGCPNERCDDGEIVSFDGDGNEASSYPCPWCDQRREAIGDSDGTQD